jgi:hypothetical protein
VVNLSLVANDRVAEDFDHGGLLTPARQELSRLTAKLAAARWAHSEAHRPVDRLYFAITELDAAAAELAQLRQADDRSTVGAEAPSAVSFNRAQGQFAKAIDGKIPRSDHSVSTNAPTARPNSAGINTAKATPPTTKRMWIGWCTSSQSAQQPRTRWPARMTG